MPYCAVLKILPRMFSGGSEEQLDDQTLSMLESIVDEMPLRSLVLLSGRKVGWRAVDTLIAVLNRCPTRLRRKRNGVALPRPGG